MVRGRPVSWRLMRALPTTIRANRFSRGGRDQGMQSVAAVSCRRRRTDPQIKIRVVHLANKMLSWKGGDREMDSNGTGTTQPPGSVNCVFMAGR